MLWMPLQMVKRMAFLSPYVVAAEIVALRLMGVHRFPWRYVGLREMTVIAKALVAPAILFSAVRLAAGAVVEQHLRAQYAVVPFGVILINLGAAIAGITGVRALVRLWHERRRQGRRAEGVRTLLVGAGDAGVAVANQLAGGDSPGLDVVGFLDE